MLLKTIVKTYLQSFPCNIRDQWAIARSYVHWKWRTMHLNWQLSQRKTARILIEADYNLILNPNSTLWFCIRGNYTLIAGEVNGGNTAPFLSFRECRLLFQSWFICYFIKVARYMIVPWPVTLIGASIIKAVIIEDGFNTSVLLTAVSPIFMD